MPITFSDANEFVRRHHRHHRPVAGCKFCLAVAHEEQIVGVAIVGRPVSRHIDNGGTLEVNRLCTDGKKNACSMLYGAAWRVAKNLGYKKLVTYTLPDEGGASLKASNWKCLGETKGGAWTRAKRPRLDLHPLQIKLKWETT